MIDVPMTEGASRRTARRAVYSRRSASGPAAAVRDLRDGLAMGPVWRAFAWDEIQARYRRSALGLAWIVVAHLIFIGAIVLFFADFSAAGTAAFVAYVGLGFTAFNFLIGNVVDGCAVFTGASSWIRSAPLPYSIYVYKSIARSLFVFAIQLAVTLALIAAIGWRPTWHAAAAAPAFVLFVVNAVWIQTLLGLVAARWRDVAHLISAVTRMLFFTTPILWVYEERGGLVRRAADLNPLTHFLTVFRAPLLGEAAPLGSWLTVLGWTAFGWAAALAAASVMRRRLPFWV